MSRACVCQQASAAGVSTSSRGRQHADTAADGLRPLAGQVREGAERADRCLREIIDAGAASDADVAAAVRRVGEAGDMLSPALLALEAKTAKFSQLAWGYITRLASYDALSLQAFSAVATALKAAVDGSGSDEHVLLRVLQCIGACLQAHILLSSRTAVCALVEAALTLHASKSAVMSNTAGATLRHGVSTLFEFAADGAEAPGPSGSTEFMDVAAAVVGDLTLLTVGSAPQMLQVKGGGGGGGTELLCLDILDTILREHGCMCMQHEAMRQALASVMIPWLLRQLEQNLAAKTRENRSPLVRAAACCPVWTAS